MPLSARNPQVQRLRRLVRQRAERVAAGAFVVEGRKLVNEAVEADVALEAVFVTPSTPAPAQVDAPVYVVDERVLHAALDAVSSQGIAAIARRPTVGVEDVVVEATPVVVLTGVADPGNAGTLVRSAEAAGCGAVFFCDGSVDPFAPKSVRASAGSILRVPVVCDEKGVEVLEELGHRGVRRLGTSARVGTSPEAEELAGAFALVLGGESHGLSDEVVALLDGSLRIPMAGGAESLNVGVAGSVVLFEAARQRRESAA